MGRVRQGHPVDPTSDAAPCSQGVGADLAGADAPHVVDRLHPHLAVADLAGTCHLDETIDHSCSIAVAAEHLEARLRREVDAVLGTSVHLGVTALATVTLR